MQNINKNKERLHNRVAAGKEPVGDFPLPQKGFDKFCKFCEQRLNNKQLNIK